MFVDLDGKLTCENSVEKRRQLQRTRSNFDMATYSSGHHAMHHGLPQVGQLDQESSYGACRLSTVSIITSEPSHSRSKVLFDVATCKSEFKVGEEV